MLLERGIYTHHQGRQGAFRIAQHYLPLAYLFYVVSLHIVFPHSTLQTDLQPQPEKPSGACVSLSGAQVYLQLHRP